MPCGAACPRVRGCRSVQKPFQDRLCFLDQSNLRWLLSALLVSRGRALEHAVSKQSRTFIRMKDPSSGKFIQVITAQAKGIRTYMRQRVATLLGDMASQGLHWCAGKAPVKLDGGETGSVDLRCWLTSRKTYASLEMKWPRRGLPAALVYGRRSLDWLRSAARSGVWHALRKKVSAGAVGVLAVGPTTWGCQLNDAY